MDWFITVSTVELMVLTSGVDTADSVITVISLNGTRTARSLQVCRWRSEEVYGDVS
jgi:hypothetical protein